jgi:uncharacterized protein YjiS (DUF1127 family)
MFRLAQLNSEIKYILHSITTDVPRYTYPQIPEISVWQYDLEERLKTIYAGIPHLDRNNDHFTKLCQIRYHEVTMLLFRPTPRIRIPAKESLAKCYKSADLVIQLWKELYNSDRITYPWTTIHSLCLSSITMLYCIWMVPEVTASVKIDEFTSTMRSSSNILSAAGEHWTEARRSRNSLEDLTAATIRWLLDIRLSKRTQNGDAAHTAELRYTGPTEPQITNPDSANDLPEFDFPVIDTYISGEDFALFVGAPDLFSNDFSLTVEGLFREYEPFLDFSYQ